MARKPKSKNTDLLLGAVIDGSGSMGWLRDDTIRSFDRLIEEQQKVDGSNAYVSLVIFNNQVTVPYVARDVHEVPALGSADCPYMPSGGTALYDAAVTMIEGVDAWLANHPTFGGKVLIAITTDGQENGSRTSLQVLNDLIADRTTKGWMFSFLGTGGSAWTEGRSFASTVGGARTVTASADAAGVSSTYAVLSNTSSMLRGGATMDSVNMASMYDETRAAAEPDKDASK